MVLRGGLRGRVGRCRDVIGKGDLRIPFSFSCANSSAHVPERAQLLEPLLVDVLERAHVVATRQAAHLDIAGVTWSNKDKPTVPKGGTGFGVRLLDELVRTNYE